MKPQSSQRTQRRQHGRCEAGERRGAHKNKISKSMEQCFGGEAVKDRVFAGTLFHDCSMQLARGREPAGREPAITAEDAEVGRGGGEAWSVVGDWQAVGFSWRGWNR